MISKLWRGLPSKVNAAFSGTSHYNWRTHFFSNSQFYIFNDRFEEFFTYLFRIVFEFDLKRNIVLTH